MSSTIDLNKYIEKKRENQDKKNKKSKSSTQDQDAFNIISEEIYRAENSQGAKSQSGSAVINQVYTDNLVLKDNGSVSQKYSKDIISEVYKRIEKNRYDNDILELRQKIKYNGIEFNDAHIYFKKYFDPMIKMPEEGQLNREDYVATAAKVIMHTIWQLKRNLHDLPVKNHCCFSLISPNQGNGKTDFFLNLFKPVFHYKRLAVKKNLYEIIDSRESEDNAKKLLILIDEMAGAAKSDFAEVKSRMTADELNSRPLYHSMTVTYKHKTTYIATANTDNLGEHLVDKSGDRNRRFFPVLVDSFINVKIPKDQLNDFFHLNSEEKRKGYLYPAEFDGTCLLRFVDENWECFLPLEEMRSVQEIHRSKSDVEEFIDLIIIQNPIPGTVRNYSIAELHSCFKRMFPRTATSIRKFSILFEKYSKIEKNKCAGDRKNSSGFNCSVDKYIWELHMGK